MLPALTPETHTSILALNRPADETGAGARRTGVEPFRTILARLHDGQDDDDPAAPSDPAADRDAADESATDAAPEGPDADLNASPEAGEAGAGAIEGSVAGLQPSSRSSGFAEFLALPDAAAQDHARSRPLAEAPPAAPRSQEAMMQDRFTLLPLATRPVPGPGRAVHAETDGPEAQLAGATPRPGAQAEPGTMPWGEASPAGAATGAGPAPGGDPRDGGLPRPDSAWTPRPGETAPPISAPTGAADGLPASEAPGTAAAPAGAGWPLVSPAGETARVMAPSAIDSPMSPIGETPAFKPGTDPAEPVIARVSAGADGPVAAANAGGAQLTERLNDGQSGRDTRITPGTEKGRAAAIAAADATSTAPGAEIPKTGASGAGGRFAPAPAGAALAAGPAGAGAPASGSAPGTAAQGGPLEMIQRTAPALDSPDSRYRAARLLTETPVPKAQGGSIPASTPAAALAVTAVSAREPGRPTAAPAAAQAIATPRVTAQAGPARGTATGAASAMSAPYTAQATGKAAAKPARTVTDAAASLHLAFGAEGPADAALADGGGADPALRAEAAPRLDAPGDARAAAPGTAQTAHRIAAQIGTALQTAEPTGAGGFELALEPAELGQVRLKLVSLDSTSLLIVHAERPETLDLMRRHIGALEQDLRALGHDNLTMRFSGGEQGRQGTGGEGPPRPAVSGAESRALPESATAAPAPPRLAARDHLDLRL